MLGVASPASSAASPDIKLVFSQPSPPSKGGCDTPACTAASPFDVLGLVASGVPKLPSYPAPSGSSSSVGAPALKSTLKAGRNTRNMASGQPASARPTPEQHAKTSASKQTKGRPKTDITFFVSLHLQNFRDAKDDSPIFFGTDKGNYMRKMLRHLKDCQDAVLAADEALAADPEDEECMQRFTAFQLLKKKMEVATNCLKAAHASGLHSPVFADTMRKEVQRMTLPPEIGESFFPSCMLMSLLKSDLEEVSDSRFWQRLQKGSFANFGMSDEEVKAHQEQVLLDKVSRVQKGV